MDRSIGSFIGLKLLPDRFCQLHPPLCGFRDLGGNDLDEKLADLGYVRMIDHPPAEHLAVFFGEFVLTGDGAHEEDDLGDVSIRSFCVVHTANLPQPTRCLRLGWSDPREMVRSASPQARSDWLCAGSR